MVSKGTGLPRRADGARKALITYIQDHRLKKGDRLPAYAQLRAEFGFGSRTIASAVDSLCKLGVLCVKDKVGLFVQNPDGGHLTGRTVAVAVRRLAGSAYAATLASFIQKLLAEQNCRCMTFYQNTDPAESPCPGFDEFPGMEQALVERHCDGVITLCPLAKTAQNRLKEMHLPCCFLGDSDGESMPLSVLIEVERFLLDAADALRNAGCRRIVQFCVSEQQKAARESASLPALVGASYDGGAALASSILAMPAAKRPDGIVSDDDTIVSGFLAELIARQLPEVKYLPRIATIMHSELGERYPSDRVILFRQDMEEYASLAVDVLLDALRGGKTQVKQFYYRFTPVENK
ncbi:MAG: GntR family transcriptional regulator [Lentisphaeria bacterium]|nr:GntR family transcriptional regulator [Lentisphaeria bacterium]